MSDTREHDTDDLAMMLALILAQREGARRAFLWVYGDEAPERERQIAAFFPLPGENIGVCCREPETTGARISASITANPQPSPDGEEVQVRKAYYDNPVMIGGFPRSHRTDHWTPAERAIHDAMQVVESVGADPLLTDAVILLGDAQRKVAEYVDRRIQAGGLRASLAPLSETTSEGRNG